MRSNGTMMKRQPLKMTALSLAVAQAALVLSGAAQAQTSDEAVKTVVVTGQRGQVETAQRLKQEADQIVDSVVADEAGKLPDKSITEVLQRVVGVTMDRNRTRTGATLAANGLEFDVEGSGVQVRGLSWTGSTLNGRETFSAGWPGRELSWGDVPPELMAGVDVYKNPSAELIEGGISGQINLRTLLPFDSKGERRALSLSNNYNEVGRTHSPGISGLYSNRWKSSLGEFGVLIDLSYNKTMSRADSMDVSPLYPRTDILPGRTAWVPIGSTWGTSKGETERGGLYGAFQWKDANKSSTLTYFDSGFRTMTERASMFIGSEYEHPVKYSNATFDDRGVFQTGVLSMPIGGKGANHFAEGGLATGTTQNFAGVHGRTRDISWNFKAKLDENLTVQTDLQWVHSHNRSNDGMLNMGSFTPEIGLDIRGSQPIFSFSDKTRAFLADPKNYYWGIAQPYGVKAKGDLYAWKTDAKYDFDHPRLRDLRFGVRLTKRSASRHRSAGVWKSYVEDWAVKETKVPGQWPEVNDLGWQRPNIGYLSDPRYAALGQTEQFAFPDFFNGRMSAPPAIIVPSKAMVHDKPNAYLKLLEALRLNCQIAAEYRGQAADCSNAGGTWSPDNFDNATREYLSEHSERTQAMFGALRFAFDDWKYPMDGNLGLRVVRTSTVAMGNMKFEPTYGENTHPAVPRFGKINEPIDSESSHVDVMPSLNLKFNLTDKLQSRLALSRGIYRPNFQDLQEYVTLEQKVDTDPADSSKITQIHYTGTNTGNAKLKPLKADNFDISLEWYPHPGQSLTAVAFYKKVKDVIIRESYSRTVKDLAGNDQEFDIVGPANSAKLWVAGIEIAGLTYLDKVGFLADRLPDWAKGFGVSANFTYIDGKQELYKPFAMKYCTNSASISGNLYGCDTNSIPFSDLPVPYFSKRAANFAFMYDRGPISARLAYSWRDRTLLATGVYGARGERGTSADPAIIAANGGVAPRDTRWYLPVWQEAVGQWDAGVNYRVNDRIWAAFNISNITETVTRQTHQQHVGTTGRSWFDPGRSYRLSMGYNF